MTASKVTPPTEEEGTDVDGTEEAGGVTVLVWLKKGLTPSNGRCIYGTYDGEVCRLRIGNRRMAENPRDS